jgi:hypothetical protein
MTLDDLPLSRRQPPAARATGTLAPASTSASIAGAESITIDDRPYRAIREFARRMQVTSYTFWLCALAILFHVYSGKRKIAFFGNTAGRTLTHTEHVIGWFANSSLIGLQVSPEAPALEVLQHVRAATLEAQQRDDLPLGALWGTFLKEGRFEELARGDWIAMNFGEYRRIRVEHWGVDGLSMQPFDLGISSRSGTAVNIGIMHRGDRFVVSCTYHADRLASEEIRQLLDDLRRVSAQLVANPLGVMGAFAGVIDDRSGGSADAPR